MNRESICSLISCQSLTWITAAPFLVAAIAGSYAVWLWWYQRMLPGPSAWPLIGCLPTLSANWDRLHDWILEQFSADRRTIFVHFAYPNVGVFTVDPANVEHILKTNFSNYPKGETNCYPMRELFGVGIFTTDGELWKEQRRMASYEFSSATLRDFSTDVFREYAVKLVVILARFASTGAEFDLQDMCMRMTLDTTCKIGFGVELDCLSPSLTKIQFAQCFDNANFISYYRFVDPLWQLKRALNIGQERKLKYCVKVLDSFTYSVIEKRRQEMASFNTKPAQSDLLSRLTDMCNRGGEISHHADTALRDMILNFIVAGRDTTAGTLTWFFYMMISHPKIAEKIFDELSTVVSSAEKHSEELTEKLVLEFAEELTYERLCKLHYLHAALSETLRLYPAVPLDSKEAAADDVLPDGTVVKKGSMVGYVPYSMGRMKCLWGDDAEEFKPERWIQEGLFVPQPLFKFTAFQAGPRTCLGKDSAYLQMKMTAALVMRFLTFHLVSGHSLQYRTMLTLNMKYGLRAVVTRN